MLGKKPPQSESYENTPNIVLDRCKTLREDAGVAKTITIRPSVEDRRIIDRLAAKLGIKTSQVIKIALRKLAAAENLRMRVS